MPITINNLKTLIKSNLNLTILVDYLIGLTGMNFEEEYEIINLIQKDCPVILDVGAHKGESIKNFLGYKPKSRIYAFEPNQLLAQNLQAKYKRKKNITIFDSAVSNKKKLILFTPYINGYAFSGLSSVSKKNIIERLNSYYSFDYKENISFKIKKINSIRIDDLSLNPDLIKIDAEGYEFEIIKTGLKTINKSRPIIIIEFNTNSFDKLNNLLNKYNYIGNIYNKKRNKPLERINTNIIKKIKKERNLVNLVYMHRNSKSLQKIKH
jgi:FkbM family methyltransferase